MSSQTQSVGQIFHNNQPWVSIVSMVKLFMISYEKEAVFTTVLALYWLTWIPHVASAVAAHLLMEAAIHQNHWCLLILNNINNFSVHHCTFQAAMHLACIKCFGRRSRFLVCSDMYLWLHNWNNCLSRGMSYPALKDSSTYITAEKYRFSCQ